jgi:sRNA-binding protein
VANALAGYCTDAAYHRAIIESADRIDLDGENAGGISDGAKQYAARRLPKVGAQP